MSDHEVKAEMNHMLTMHIGMSLIGLSLLAICLVHNIGQ